MLTLKSRNVHAVLERLRDQNREFFAQYDRRLLREYALLIHIPLEIRLKGDCSLGNLLAYLERFFVDFQEIGTWILRSALGSSCAPLVFTFKVNTLL
jgi:hypothetical protein